MKIFNSNVRRHRPIAYFWSYMCYVNRKIQQLQDNPFTMLSNLDKATGVPKGKVISS